MRPSTVAAFALASLFATGARAQSRYALPPDENLPEPPRFEPESTVRLSVGPALRVASAGADGGLGAALDIGARGSGGRFSGTWVRVGSDRGVSAYTAELWVDFGAPRRLRPIVAAGAGVARLDTADASGAVNGSTVGLGVLRGSLEYVLPIADASARVGVDLSGALPAIRSQAAPDIGGWLVATLRVGIGF